MKYDSGIFCGQPVGIHRGLHLWYRRWCDHQTGIGRHECDERIMYWPLVQPLVVWPAR